MAIEDNLKIMKISLASRCYCCENGGEETMSHLFLTTPISLRLWREFATCAGIIVEGSHLQHLISKWWKDDFPNRVQPILKSISMIII